MQPKRLQPMEIRDAYAHSSRRLLILDYDGRLPRPPIPHTSRRRHPLSFTCSKRSHLSRRMSWFLLPAGKPRTLIAGSEAFKGMWLVAEHYAELKPSRAPSWQLLLSEVSANWQATVMPILEHRVDRTPGSFVEEKEYALAWHYRMAEPEFGEWLSNELASMLEAMLAETELRAFRGDKIVEISRFGPIRVPYWSLY
jgi:trehalose 6-phosphate synthase/phosphatase